MNLQIYSGLFGEMGAGEASIPESNVDAVFAAIQKPDGYRLMYGGGDAGRFGATCNTGGIWSAAYTGDCELTQAISQPYPK